MGRSGISLLLHFRYIFFRYLIIRDGRWKSAAAYTQAQQAVNRQLHHQLPGLRCPNCTTQLKTGVTMNNRLQVRPRWAGMRVNLHHWEVRDQLSVWLASVNARNKIKRFFPSKNNCASSLSSRGTPTRYSFDNAHTARKQPSTNHWDSAKWTGLGHSVKSDRERDAFVLVSDKAKSQEMDSEQLVV